MNYLIYLYSDWLGKAIESHEVLAPLLLLFVEEMGVPIIVPGDAILAYTGLRVSQTQSLSLWLAFGVALIAVLGGATILFFVARRYGRGFIDKLGRFIFLKESHIVRAEKLFAKYGAWTIIFGRHIPGMRIPITIFAAVSGIKYWVFILSTFVSTIWWILLYLHLGKRYGGDIQRTIHQYLGISIGVLAGLVVLAVGLHFWGAYKENRPKVKP